MRLPRAMQRDAKVAAWFAVTDPLRLMARPWFGRMRACGADVREILHDGYPVVCVGDAPFGYVAAFKAHANVGFFYGAGLPDPTALLEGSGRNGRHVKLRPGAELNADALEDVIAAAYSDIRRRLTYPD